MHVHVSVPDGEAKFWIEPVVALERCYNCSEKQLREMQNIVEERVNEIKKAWKRHFKS